MIGAAACAERKLWIGCELGADPVAGTLQKLGAGIRDVRLPTLGEFAAVNRVILQSEAWAIHGQTGADLVPSRRCGAEL